MKFIKNRPQFNEEGNPSDKELKMLWGSIAKEEMKTLDLSHVHILGENKHVTSLFTALKTSSLQHVNLCDTHLSNKDIEYVSFLLKRSETLHILNVSENFIGNRSMSSIKDALRTNNTLKHLDLSQSKTSIKTHKSRMSQDDFTTPIGERGLHECFISNIGAKHLAEMLTTNRSLNSLNLRHQGIANEGAIALLNALQGEHGNHTLTTLALEGNFIYKSILEQIEICLERNRKIAFEKATGPTLGPELITNLFNSTINEKTTMRVMPKPIAKQIWSELENRLSPEQKLTMILVAKEKEKEKEKEKGQEKQEISHVEELEKRSNKDQKCCVVF